MITPIEATRYFREAQTWKTVGLDLQYIIECDEERNVIVIFQGSNSDMDWKHNFQFWKKPYKDMPIKFRVHSGFLKIWQSGRDQIMKEIANLNPATITIIGHSLGGSICQLCHENCWFDFIYSREQNPQEGVESLRGKIHSIAFGSPRVLGLLNARKVKERWEGTTLINNSSDIVPAAPPFFFFYTHVTEQTHIGHLRHWWDFFRPDKWHTIGGDEGYYAHLKEAVEGK